MYYRLNRGFSAIPLSYLRQKIFAFSRFFSTVKDMKKRFRSFEKIWILLAGILLWSWFLHQNSPHLFVYDREKAVEYAQNWIFTRNADFWYFRGKLNCTNFVSQALQAWGKWQKGIFSFWKRTKPTIWHAGFLFLPPSYTWWWAHNMHEYFSEYSDIFEKTDDLSRLELWDIIQMDYWKNGHINHTMIITKKLWNTPHDIFVSYNNEYNQLLTDAYDISLANVMREFSLQEHGYVYWHIKN